MQVQGCRALVTGAGRGLGAAFVQALLAAGAAQVHAGMREPTAVAPALPVKLDVTDPTGLQAAALACGDIDLLVNNAGVIAPGDALFAPGGVEALQAQLAVNLFGMLHASRAFAGGLGRRGGGCIVNVLSALSWASLPGTSAYSVSKAAAWALGNGMRNELRAQGTRVIAVHVGYIDTDMAAHVDAPKMSALAVAQRVLHGIGNDEEEILVDDTARQVKAGLGWPRPLYLG